MKKIILISLLVLTACSPTADKMNALKIGMDKSEVVAALGQPESISADKNTEVLHYSFAKNMDDASVGYTQPYFAAFKGGKLNSYGPSSTSSPIITNTIINTR